jgi:hypothetical protein
MRAKFSAPLAARIKPDFRPHPISPEQAKLASQLSDLGGTWNGIDALPYSRRRAIHQVIGRVRKLKDHDNPWAYLILAAPISHGTAIDDDNFQSADGVDASQPEPAEIHFDADARALIDQASTKHRYVDTICLALIKRAKDAGSVLPSSDFLWARSADPNFWLLINGYGRSTHKAEIVDAFVHFTLEMELGRPVSLSEYR